MSCKNLTVSFTVKKRGCKNTKKSRCGYRRMGVGLKGLSIMPSASIHRWRDRRSTWDILSVAFTFSCPLCCKHAVWKITKGKAQVFYINIIIYYKSFKSKVYIFRDVPLLLYFKNIWLCDFGCNTNFLTLSRSSTEFGTWALQSCGGRNIYGALPWTAKPTWEGHVV